MPADSSAHSMPYMKRSGLSTYCVRGGSREGEGGGRRSLGSWHGWRAASARCGCRGCTACTHVGDVGNVAADGGRHALRAACEARGERGASALRRHKQHCTARCTHAPSPGAPRPQTQRSRPQGWPASWSGPWRPRRSRTRCPRRWRQCRRPGRACAGASLSGHEVVAHQPAHAGACRQAHPAGARAP